MYKFQYIILLVLSFLFQAFSVVFVKFAAVQISSANPFLLITNPFYFASILCLLFQAITWQKILLHLPLFSSYLVMSLVYPSILLFSWYFFSEKITIQNMIGSLIIMIGVFIVLFKHELDVK